MFKHEDAESATIEVEIDEEQRKVLVIKTPLSLWPSSQEYAPERVSALEAAAQAYMLENKLDRIRMVSTRRFEVRRN